MKEYKRIISIFLVVAIAFLQIPNLIAYAAADATPPTIDVSTLKVDKTEATVGGKVKLSFKATDKESGIKSIYVNYKKPITGDGYGVKMNYNTSEDIYEVYINVDNNTQNGVWKINYINLTDNNENRIDIWNSNVTSISPNKEDLSAGNFTVIDDSDPVTPIEGATIVTNNESWSNKTIEGDLYIGPEAVLNVTNTVVKGNIYALGSLKSNGGLSVQGTIYGREMHWGGNPTLYNGTIVVYGANSIYSSVMTTYPVTDIPVRIDNTPLKAIDGKLDILGATIDVADMYIEGNKYDIGYKGKIRIYDLNVGDKDTVTIKFKTVFGNEIVKDYKVDHYVTSPSGKINKLPVISGADDLTIKLGDSFDPKAAVIATDAEDGDITSSIVISGQVDTNKVGEYKLTYSVTDSYESKVTKERKITVRTNEKPAISGTSDMTIKVGDSFDPKAGVTASDVADGLAATPLATYKNAPLLLTEANTLPEVTKSEIKRLSAKNAIIVGGTTVVNDNVIQQLKALGITNIERIGGSDRYDTSLEIAKYIDKNCYDVNNVVISNGLGQADALSIASVAGRDKMAIILVEKDTVPTKVYSWLQAEALENAYIIGGTTVVSDNVLNKVNGITSANIARNRLGRKDRYATNAMVIEKFYGNIINKTYIAKGLQLIDALAAGPVAALNGSPVVLSGDDLTTEQKNVLDKRYGNIIIRTGGGIPDKAVNSLKSCLQ